MRIQASAISTSPQGAHDGLVVNPEPTAELAVGEAVVSPHGLCFLHVVNAKLSTGAPMNVSVAHVFLCGRPTEIAGTVVLLVAVEVCGLHSRRPRSDERREHKMRNLDVVIDGPVPT